MSQARPRSLPARRADAAQHLVLSAVPWRSYVRILRELEGRHLRISYDRGTLEIMTLSHLHARISYLLGRMIDVITEELGIPVHSGRCTTLKRRRWARGLEPDNCCYIANAAAVQGKDQIDLRTDPPPDLALEVEISRSSLNRMRIYAALGVPEVWRCDGLSVQPFALSKDRKYEPVAASLAFPQVPLDEFGRFLALRGRIDDTALMRQFRAWLRGALPGSKGSNE